MNKDANQVTENQVIEEKKETKNKPWMPRSLYMTIKPKDVKSYEILLKEEDRVLLRRICKNREEVELVREFIIDSFEIAGYDISDKDVFEYVPFRLIKYDKDKKRFMTLVEWISG